MKQKPQTVIALHHMLIFPFHGKSFHKRKHNHSVTQTFGKGHRCKQMQTHVVCCRTEISCLRSTFNAGQHYTDSISNLHNECTVNVYREFLLGIESVFIFMILSAVIVYHCLKLITDYFVIVFF